ncbi:MAG: hypothetical protein BGO09_05560 [Bacteroidetes bacterium 47-18]|nr:MAG: hypothetical protein BGO09_05560 [Bacteroidetes bacterium 47-18]
MNPLKYIMSVTVLLLCMAGYAQVPQYLSSTVLGEEELTSPGSYTGLAAAFNNRKVRVNQVFVRDRDNLFINYKKADTLTFDAPLYTTGAGDDYTLEGLAFYKRKNDRYELQFANDYAFFCTSCNNMQSHPVSFSGDTLLLSIYWGPSVASVSDHYSFVWQPGSRQWLLQTAYYPWTNDAGETSHTLLLASEQYRILLDTFNAELFPFHHEKGLVKFSLDYPQGDIAALEKALRTIPAAGRKYLPLLFSEDDMYVFLAILEDKLQTEAVITSSTVTGLNNIAYYLEQANSTPAAVMLLEKIIAAFPEREVAHLNLADAYTKLDRPEKAKEHYIRYLQQMRKRGLEHKVPQRVKTILDIP